MTSITEQIMMALMLKILHDNKLGAGFTLTYDIDGELWKMISMSEYSIETIMDASTNMIQVQIRHIPKEASVSANIALPDLPKTDGDISPTSLDSNYQES